MNDCRQGRSPNHPEYDPKTLLIPKPFFDKEVTPALKQWWQTKETHLDTLLFFKVGKFYELFHMDAVIAAKELGLAMMRVSQLILICLP